MKSLESVQDELKNYQELMDRIHFLRQVEVGFIIHRAMKQDDHIKVAYIKDEYNDEGLDDGVHLDYAQEGSDLSNYDYDYNSEYRERARSMPQRLKDLSTTLSHLNCDPQYKNIIADLEGSTIESSLDSAMRTVLGLPQYKLWVQEHNILVEKDQVEAVTEKTSKKSNRLKV